MIESLEVGKTTYLDNGAKATVTVLNPISIHSNLGRVPTAEASHAIINPENTQWIDGNITKVRSIDDVQAAAHHGDGDGHDRWVTEISGGNYNAAIPVADRILEERHDQVVALSSFLMDNNGKATSRQIFDLIERVESGPDLEIEITSPTGEKQKKTEKSVKGEVIIVNFMDSAEEESQKLSVNQAA